GCDRHAKGIALSCAWFIDSRSSGHSKQTITPTGARRERSAPTRCEPLQIYRASVPEIRLGIVLDMRTQLCNRPEAHRPVRKLRFNGAVRIERVGHAVDHSGLENCDRARLPLGTRRLPARGWLARDLVRL